MPPSPPKKSVVFADELGLQLTTVKVFDNSSKMPPKMSSRIGGKPKIKNVWEIGFYQPAHNFLLFRQKLEQNNVGLEKAILGKKADRLAGTVKVKNLAFEKDVFIRITVNGWMSFVNQPSTYIEGNPGDIYDTFSFDCDIPRDGQCYPTCIEFCICFKVSGAEFWDNNCGKNYKFLSQKLPDSDEWRPQWLVSIHPQRINYNNGAKCSIVKD